LILGRVIIPAILIILNWTSTNPDLCPVKWFDFRSPFGASPENVVAMLAWINVGGIFVLV
jgi:hypothetical protein